MAEDKVYWKSLEEREGSPEFLESASSEFGNSMQEPPPGWSRRSFLKATGFAFAAATLSGCQRAPVRYVLPYLVAPEGSVPAQDLWYASTCEACSSGCGILIKNRDGRPIKLEGNPDHPLNEGGLCAAGQASILGLYDRQRLMRPQFNGENRPWSEIDRRVRQELNRIREEGGKVRFLSRTITSPTRKEAVARLLRGFADGRHVVYDPISYSAILDACEQTHGTRLLPHYRLAEADTIVSFGADFLGAWISPVEFTKDYAAKRIPQGNSPSISYHVQIESRMSLTGSKADKRLCISPPELDRALTYLVSKVAQVAGVAFDTAGTSRAAVPHADELDRLSGRLWREKENGKHSLVLCGSQNVQHQKLCNFLNHLLGNYETTIDLEHRSYQYQGDDAELQSLLNEIQDDQLDALFIHQCNPVFDLPNEYLSDALSRIPLLITFAERLDETARLAAQPPEQDAGIKRFVLPAQHYLESWNDAEPVNGLVNLTQPAIQSFGQTRSLLESLSIWDGERKSAYQQIRDHWQARIFPRQTRYGNFQEFWDHTLHDGFAELRPHDVNIGPFDPSTVQTELNQEGLSNNAFSLLLYPKVSMPDSNHAYNPWLQELPDPISKVTWDNYACLSPASASELGVGQGDVVRIQPAGEGDNPRSIDLPVYLQPGQHDRIIAVALGYGSVLSERFRDFGPQWIDQQVAGASCVGPNGKVGVNVASLVQWRDGVRTLQAGEVRAVKQNRRQSLACTQMHHSINVPAHLAPPNQQRRPAIQETTLHDLGHEEEHGHHRHADLWPEDHPIDGHHWGMAIDLNACTGCSACVIACQVENNIPVVGKDEVRRQREMHWLRIDRYYAGEGDNVDVAHQPMLCQHCDNAPCEVVCPVLATVHSEEGLNQQVYNRCVGTRYCANNCPYKVRRFNWFAYDHGNDRERLVLNPEVTVRSRGVMEKCTFCVQRIQEAKLEARSRGLQLRDGDLQTACQQSCPANAIVFGDLNDPQSCVSQRNNDPRRYQVLEELNVRPSVSYLQLVRNRAP